MEELIYTIDENQINVIRNRIFFSSVKYLAVFGIPIFVFEWYVYTKSKPTGIFYAVGMIIYLSIVYYVAANKTAKGYKTLKIVLGKEGVERKADKMAYQIIAWNNLEIEEKSNGVINLNDKNVSKFARNMYGRGRIIIHPEILNRESLLAELYKRAGKW